MVEAMSVMAVLGHKKITAQQMLFFFAVAHADAMGQSVNIASVMATYAPLGRSVEKTVVNFLEPTDRFPDALGWIKQIEDPDDRRVRHLHLTEKGVDVVGAIVDALRG
jgi:hypothetical protein